MIEKIIDFEGREIDTSGLGDDQVARVVLSNFLKEIEDMDKGKRETLLTIVMEARETFNKKIRAIIVKTSMKMAIETRKIVIGDDKICTKVGDIVLSVLETSIKTSSKEDL